MTAFPVRSRAHPIASRIPRPDGSDGPASAQARRSRSKPSRCTVRPDALPPRPPRARPTRPLLSAPRPRDARARARSARGGRLPRTLPLSTPPPARSRSRSPRDAPLSRLPPRTGFRLAASGRRGSPACGSTGLHRRAWTPGDRPQRCDGQRNPNRGRTMKRETYLYSVRRNEVAPSVMATWRSATFSSISDSPRCSSSRRYSRPLLAVEVAPPRTCTSAERDGVGDVRKSRRPRDRQAHSGSGRSRDGSPNLGSTAARRPERYHAP